jgi:hypothetical protein
MERNRNGTFVLVMEQQKIVFLNFLRMFICMREIIRGVGVTE